MSLPATARTHEPPRLASGYGPGGTRTVFVRTVVAAAAGAGVSSGLFVGCGMGGTYAALVRAGLDLLGLESSPTALACVAERMPQRRDRLVCGGLEALPPGERYALVVGTQAIALGPRTAAVARLREVQRRLAPGGLLCLRVPAANGGIWPAHEVTDRHADGGLSVLFRTAHAAGSEAHYFSVAELEVLFAGRFTPLSGPRLSRVPRRPPIRGWGGHWEGVWRRTG